MALVELDPLTICTSPWEDCQGASRMTVPAQAIVRVEAGTPPVTGTPGVTSTRPPHHTSPIVAGSAGPPGNDDIAHATPIRALPFSRAVSTAGATAGADDSSCITSSAPHTVWYTITPARTMRIGLSTGLAWAVLTGSPGNLTLVACNGGRQTWTAAAGTRYYIELASDDGRPSRLLVGRAIKPQLRIVLNSPATFYHGIVVLSGTFVCNQTMPAFADLTTSQLMGRLFASNQRSIGAEACGPTPQPWRMMFASGTVASFELGTAKVQIGSDACTPFECVDPPLVSDTVTLRWGRP